MRRPPPRDCASFGRPLLVGMAVLGLAASGCSPEADRSGASTSAVAGEASKPAREQAPEFSLPTLDGETVTLSDLRGKTVIVDFWATWCPPCEFQVPELNAFWTDHGGDGDIAVFGISVDEGGPEVVRPWVEEKGVAYPILLGDDGLARRFGAMGFPTLVIIAPDGTVDSRHVGLIERASLEKALERQRAEFAVDSAESSDSPRDSNDSDPDRSARGLGAGSSARS